ncbi:helix-turn-helix transcriptional regulator [Nocardia takedensis]|uniref:helix-turn-helix transcriptional regulator n=1 Tax=Nocardia takedensis TaxID=259390 RepID=UPI003F76F26C
MEQTRDAWLTRQELAARLKLPPKTLDNWAHRGTGPRFARIGRFARYRLADVEAWEEEQFTGAA